MSREVLDLRTTGGPAVRKMIDSYSDRALVNRMRRAIRAGVAIFRVGLRSTARSDSKIPDSFAKTKTRAHRNPIGVSVRPKSPLLNIFEPGAAQHGIAPRRAPLLAGPADQGAPHIARGAAGGGGRWRARTFAARGAVTHPGMRPRKLLAPVFAARVSEAEAAVELSFAAPGIPRAVTLP